jgi:hypothetical protein
MSNQRRLQHIVGHLAPDNTSGRFETHQRKITIHYGDGPGRGEVTRMMLAYGGLDYEDIRYSGKDFADMCATTPDST